MNAQTGLTTRLARWAKGLSATDDSPGDDAPSARVASRNGSSREIERRRELYNDIGGFLFAHDLDLTPVNFGLAYDFITGNDHQTKKPVRPICPSAGRSTNPSAERTFPNATLAT